MTAELDANRAQVERLLASRALKASEIHRNLLAYLADKSLRGEGPQLKEYTVGLDVFGKPESYDPRQESIVRMHVGRLRQKLVDYYRTDGLEDPVIVALPKGGFLLTFTPRVPAAVETTHGDVPMPALAARSISAREWALAAMLIAAVACAGYLGIRLSSTQAAGPMAQTSAPSSQALQDLWAPVFSSDRPVMVTLATNASSQTSVGTANAAFLLGQFLGQRKHDVFTMRSDAISMGEVAMADVIFVGPTGGKPQIQAASPVEVAFALTSDGVRNLKPAPGEPAFLADAESKGESAQEASQSYALVSSLPGLNGNGSILYLEGNQAASVTGAVQAMTDPDLARELAQRLKGQADALPRYYQAVLLVKAVDDMIVDIAYVSHRSLTIVKRDQQPVGR